MVEFLSKLFDTSDFPERWHCGNWTAGHGWLHILSDLGVWSAYLAIPMVLIYFAWRRQDLPFRRIFWLFGAFILACGSTHLMEAAIFYWPAYRLAGIIKLFTAAVSWATVLALIPIVPLALAMRSPEELEREILERRRAEESLRQLSEELEVRVEQRTEELKSANRLLQAEILERQRAEETLRQQREWFRVTLSSIGDAVIATDAEGRVTFLNPGAEQLTGWTLVESTGKPIGAIFRIVDESTRLPVDNPVAQVLRNRSVSGLANHTLLVNRLGATRPIDDSAAPILDDQGNVLGVVMVFHDVTQRRAVEQQLRFQADILDKVGQSIVATDKSGAITYWNRYAESMYGWSADEVMGRYILDIVAAPQARPQASQIMDKLLEGEPWKGEILLKRRDGRTVPALVSETPLRNHTGEVIGVIGISMDITEQRRSREALLASERRFRFLAETIPQFVFTARPDGSIDYYNQLWYDYTGMRFDDDWRPAIHPADLERTQRQWTAAMRTGSTFEIEHRLRRGSDDSYRWFLGRARPMRDEQGHVVKWFGSYTDIDDFKKSQEALRESQDRLRLAQQAAGAGIWDWDATSGAVNWSEECFRLHGIAWETSWTREQWLSVVATDDRDHVDRETRWAIDTRSDLNVEYRIVDHHGEQRWLVSIGKIVHPEDKPERLSGITLDVTDRKRAEEAIRRAEGQFRRAIIDAPNPIIMSADDGEVLQLSRAWTTLTGYGRSDIRSIDDWWRLAQCAEAGEDGSSINTLFDADQGVQERELTIQTRDGETRVWNFTVSCPGQLHDGRKFFVGMANDITERKSNERAFRFLADASAELATLIDYRSTMQRVSGLAVPFIADWCAVDIVEPDGELRRIAVVHSDPELVLQSREWDRKYPLDPMAPVGSSRVIRTGESEIADLSDEILKHAARDDEHLQWLRSLRLRSYLCVPLKARHKTIGAITLSVTGSRRRYATADLRLAEELARRASVAIENSLLYQEVRQADQHKNEFLAMLAHELRNPLAPIRNSLCILGNEEAGAETIARAREVMQRQLSHLIRLVDDLLDVSRIMRGRIELRLELLQIAMVVARAVEISHPAIDAQGHQLTVSIPERPIWLNGDLVRLGQVVANLLQNAAKYTEKQGRISLTAAFENDELTLRVTDNGIGIAADMLPRVFDLFTQADRSLSRSQGGLGIGLTLVRKLVEMHGGRVEARSAGIGHGSEFVVRLPAHVDEKKELSLPPEPAGPPNDATLPRRRVLVVDDNIDAAESLGVLFELEGSDVRLAHNGATALAIAEEFLPDIVLLDIGMPGMDGYEVARKLPGRMPTEHSLIVAVTGWGQDEDRRRSREAGFDDHFVKPVDPIAIHELMSHPKLAQSPTP